MEIEKRIVEPLEGYSREIGYYLSSFQWGREQTRKVLSDLTPAEIAARFLPEIHSIGSIALHLGECEYWYFQSILPEKEMTEEGIALCHFCDTTENDYDRGFTAEYLINTLDKIFTLTCETLRGYTDEDLDNKTHPRPGRPVEFSLRFILQQSIDHEANHRGQISMIKRLLRERA